MEFDRLCASADPGFANPGVGVQVSACNRDGWAPGNARGMGPSVPHVGICEMPDPEPWWRKLWRVRIPGEHRRAVSAWPGIEAVAERTPGGSKASKRACRPLTGEPSVCGMGRHVRHAHRAGRGDRTSDRREPSSRLMRPGSTSGWVLGQTGRRERRKRPRSSRRLCAGGSRTRTRKEESARESGHGSPGRESSAGKFQGRERHERRPRSVGGHGERRGPRGSRASREPAETVERGKNPEDGADGRVATPVLRGRPKGSLRRRRGTRRKGVRGSKNPRRGRPARLGNGSAPS